MVAFYGVGLTAMQVGDGYVTQVDGLSVVFASGSVAGSVYFSGQLMTFIQKVGDVFATVGINHFLDAFTKAVVIVLCQ